MVFKACALPRNCGTIALLVAAINAVVFFGVVRNWTVLDHQLVIEAAAAASADRLLSSEQQLQTIDSVPQKTNTEHSNSSAAALDASSGISSATLFPVCVLLSTGDDVGRADDVALPFSLLYRLFDPAKAKFASLVNAAREGGADNSPPLSSTKRSTDFPVKVFVGVDDPSVACKMARDSLEDSFRGQFPKVELTCGTPDNVRNRLVDSSGANATASSKFVRCGTVLVGRSAKYVAQLALDWELLIRWENVRVIDLDERDSSHGPPMLPSELWLPTVVTAFSSNHFAVGLLLLRSLGQAGMEAAGAGEYNISIVVFALEKFNSTLQGILDCLVRELNEDYKIPTEVRRFNFSAYPSWMRINQTKGYRDGGTGEYGWKAVIIHSVLVERGFIIWSDAGCRFDREGLTATLTYALDFGFANMASPGVVPFLVHPGQVKYFRYKERRGYVKMANCDGSRIGLTLDKYETLVRPWYDCSLTRQCIAPDGSNRDNHRQDQAALTLIADMSGSPCEGFSLGVWTQMDDKPADCSRAFPTRCYADPLQMNVDPEQ